MSKNKPIRTTLLILSGLITSLNIYSKDTDSLFLLLEASKGLARVDVLNQIAGEIAEDEIYNARELCAEAKKLALEHSYTKGLGEVYLNLGHIGYYANQFEISLANYDTALYYFRQTDYIQGLADALYEQGYIHLHYGDYKRALSEFLEAENIYIKLDLAEDLAYTYHNIAISYDFLEQDTLAIKYYNKSLQISKQTKLSLGQTYANLGWVYRDLDNYYKAFENFYNALEFFKLEADSYHIATSLHNLGSIYLDWNDYETAVELLNKSLDILDKQEPSRRLASLYDDIGRVYFLRMNYALADTFYNKAISLHESLNNKFGLQESFINKGNLALAQNDIRVTKRLFYEALRINTQLENINGLYHAKISLGNLFLQQNKVDSAEFFFLSALQMMDSTKLPGRYIDVYDGLAKVYSMKKNFETAYKYADLYNMHRDSLFDIQNYLKINEISTRYKQEEIVRMLDQKNRELSQANRENQVQRTIIFMMIVLIIFVMFAGYFLYKLYRENKRSNTRLKEQNAEIIKSREALLEAKEKAEESDKLKTAFLTNISHEIRTPMNGVIGFSKLLLQKSLSEDKKEKYVEIITKNSTLLLKLINDLLDLSKIEMNQIRINKSDFSIKYLLQILETQYTEKIHLSKKNQLSINLYVHPDIDEKKLTIYGDMDRIHQIFINLLDNSLKFTDIGTIQFGLKSLDKTALFFVKDTGIGIKKSNQKIVFEHFRQVDESSTRKYGGSGLGLSICKGLVERMQGNIWIESEENEGTEVLFSIPVSGTNEILAPMNNYLEVTDIKTVKFDWTDKTILIAEDEEINFFYLKEALEDTHANIIHAVNGRQAVEIIKENPQVDLVLMDIKMPIMDGYKATNEIKKVREAIPVIAQTAYAMSGEKKKSFEAGCDDYLFKPIQPELLISTVAKYLNK